MEGSVGPAVHFLRTLGYAGVRRWVGNRVRKISLLPDLAIREVDLGLATVMVAREGEGNVLSGRLEVPSYFKQCTQKPRGKPYVHFDARGPSRTQASDQPPDHRSAIRVRTWCRSVVVGREVAAVVSVGKLEMCSMEHTKIIERNPD